MLYATFVYSLCHINLFIVFYHRLYIDAFYHEQNKYFVICYTIAILRMSNVEPLSGANLSWGGLLAATSVSESAAQLALFWHSLIKVFRPLAVTLYWLYSH